MIDASVGDDGDLLRRNRRAGRSRSNAGRRGRSLVRRHGSYRPCCCLGTRARRATQREARVIARFASPDVGGYLDRPGRQPRQSGPRTPAWRHRLVALWRRAAVGTRARTPHCVGHAARRRPRRSATHGSFHRSTAGIGHAAAILPRGRLRESARLAAPAREPCGRANKSGRATPDATPGGLRPGGRRGRDRDARGATAERAPRDCDYFLPGAVARFRYVSNRQLVCSAHPTRSSTSAAHGHESQGKPSGGIHSRRSDPPFARSRGNDDCVRRQRRAGRSHAARCAERAGAASDHCQHQARRVARQHARAGRCRSRHARRAAGA